MTVRRATARPTVRPEFALRISQTGPVDQMTNGMFRGICVDNRDPKNLGRIRVQVPQILGTSASGWAFPAWSFQQKIVWPQDRLPNAGDGVWVMFDSTSPDKMIWIAAFGPLDLINQPGFVETPSYLSNLSLSVDSTPTWNEVCRFGGILSSDGGIPNPNPLVYLNGRVSGGNWKNLGSVTPNSVDGSWSIDHLVELTGSVEYRASFNGTGVFSSAASEVIKVETPEVTFPTTLTMAMTTPSPALGKTVTFSGTLVTGGEPPPGYGIPKPDVKIALFSQQGAGPWTQVVGNIAVDETTGAWSAPYTIALAGSVNYRANFAGKGIYLASQSNVVNVNTSVATTVSTPVLPALFNGSGFNVSGTVKVTSTGASVTAGTVELWWRYTTGDTTWKKSTVSAAITTGAYSLTHPTLSIVGPTEWQVRYLGTTAFNASNSASVAGTVNLKAMGALTKGAVSHTAATFSWAAIPGATSYEVSRLVGSTWTVLNGSLAALTFTSSGLVKDSQYGWRVRARSGTYYGAYSATISMKTGHPQVIDSGSTPNWISVTATVFRCHRKDTGWQGSGSYEMRQGYFSSLYDGDGYIGIARIGGSTLRDKIIDACGAVAGGNGSARQANGTCSAAQITLRRSGTGTVGSTNVNFYTTTSTGTGERPTLQGTKVSVAASGYDASKTYNIGTAHGQRLGDAAAESVAIYSNAKSAYLGLNGSGTNGGKLEVKWAWNYVLVALVPAAWL